MVAERHSFRGQALQGILEQQGILDQQGEGDATAHRLLSWGMQTAVVTIQHLT